MVWTGSYQMPTPRSKFGAQRPGQPAPTPSIDPAVAQGMGAWQGGGSAYNPSAAVTGSDPNAPAPGWGSRAIKNRFSDALNRTGDVAGRAEDAYLSKATSFDARDYAGQTAQGIYNRWMPDLKQSIGDLRGAEVAGGRLDTGFGTEDEDRLVTGATRDLNDAVARTSMQAAGLDQQNTQGLGDFGNQYGGRYMEGIAGQNDWQTQEANAKKQKKGWFGKLLGAGVDVASKFL